MLRVILLLNFLLGSAAFARIGGSSDSGGGDAYVLEFTAVGEQIAKWLKDNQINDISGLNYEKFKTTLETATLISTDEPLILDGLYKDAINYPSERKIVFNRQRWKTVSAEFRKVGIVFHEILGLLKIDDQGYKVTIPFASRITGVNPQKIRASLYSYTCESLASVHRVNGEGYTDTQSVVVGYDSSGMLIGLQNIVHKLEGKVFYLAASIALGGSSSEPNEQIWKAEYLRVSRPFPIDPIYGMWFYDSAQFDAYNDELPTTFAIPLWLAVEIDKFKTARFRLKCRLNQ